MYANDTAMQTDRPPQQAGEQNMDDAMRDTFARQGYVVVPDVLNQQQLDELNKVYDQHILEREEALSKAGTDQQNPASSSADGTGATLPTGTATRTQDEDSGARPTKT